MDPLSIVGTLITVLQITTTVISICYDYRSGVASASREALQITDSLNSLKDTLESLLRLIETSKSGELPTVELLAKDGGTLQSCMAELERLRRELEPGEGWRKVRRSLIWPLKEGEMRRALEVLERWKSTMQLALSADQATLSLAIKDDVEDLTQMFQRHSIDKKRQDIYRWLGAPDPYTNHVTNRKKRMSQTGLWLLKSKQYDHWLQSENSFLWIYGIPGSGKTVLCSTVIEQLVRYSQQIPRTAVAYFYFDFNDTGKRDSQSLIRSLMTQLSAQCDAVPLPLLELFDNCKDSSKSIDEDALIGTVKNLILIFHNIYIIFDALDESSDSQEVLTVIHTIQDWNLARIHLLVTSRQLAHIEESLTDSVTDKICLQDSEMNEDIILYVADKLENDKSLSRFPPDIRLQIQTKLLEGEDGMFQWVVCQLDMLRRCMSVAAIRKALAAGFPKNLDQTYDLILSEIEEVYQQDVLKALQALTATMKPLSLEEIVEILAIDLDSDAPHFDPDSRLLDPRSILLMCSSLVTTVKTRRRTPYPEEQDATLLKLAHASVADYLTQPKPHGPSQFHFSTTTSRQFMAQCCLTYLMNPEFGNGHAGPTSGQLEVMSSSYPLLMHAIYNWPKYLTKIAGDPDDYLEPRTREILHAFFDTRNLPSGGNFTFWVGMLIPESPYDQIRKTHPLYYAASFGLTDIVRIILDSEKDLNIDALGGRAHSTALHVATYRDHIDIVRILLDQGADPNLQNNMSEPPLYWAALNGNQEMQELLIKHGSKELRGFWGRPLIIPSAQDRLDEMLITRSFKLDD